MSEQPEQNAAMSAQPETQEPQSVPMASRMKANKAIDGSICPICNNEIELGDDIFVCSECQTAHHYECHEGQGGCGNASCPAYKAEGDALDKLALSEDEGSEDEGASGDDMKECPYCGEMVKTSAKKCKHCKEILDKAMKRRRTQAAAAAGDDDNLTAAEIIFGVLCGGIACIVGLVWGCMGKKKGWKLMLIALVSQFILGFLRALARH
ncbi:MAG: hypothetical protein JXR97_05950 [Planctomycetes bacterium]|nr:hypothetical protein [Planctomycetota bacterium]